MATSRTRDILVLGGTGYVGGRLIPELLADGHRIRCLTRDPDRLDDRPWRDRIDVRAGDLLEPATLSGVAEGIDTIVYLVHSLGAGDDFEEIERRCAFAARGMAEHAGVERIIYLSGLGDDTDDLSPHLRSRHAVGRELAGGPVPVLEIRAAVILGSGSASFEMLRGLVEVLPVMVTPRWVQRTRCQPVAVGDVLLAIRQVLDVDDAQGIVEIGGPDVVTYEELMQLYARVAGLRPRVIVPVPFVTPKLSTYWVDLVTALPRRLAGELVLGLQNDVVVRNRPIGEVVSIDPLGAADAIGHAVAAVQDLDIPTRWSTHRPLDPARPRPFDPEWSGGTVLEDRRERLVDAPPNVVLARAAGLGGANGWLSFDRLWRLRGLLDDLAGGGGRRGRRHPTEAMVGDAVDFFVVESVDEDHLRLRAEMRMPGFGWLEWSVADAGGRTCLRQHARFVPSGVAGRLYWWALLPFHALIFGRLIDRLAAAAEEESGEQESREQESGEQESAELQRAR